jgi:hypothetical protein
MEVSAFRAITVRDGFSILRKTTTPPPDRAARMEPIQMDKLEVTTRNDKLQPHPPLYLPRPKDPLRGAVVANAQLRLCLRQLRAGAPGSHRAAAISRLVNTSEAIGRSLDWLRGGPGAADDCLELAMESQAIPDAVEAVAQ